MADVPRSIGSGAGTTRAGQSFFQVYKKGQGYYTRVGTAVGAGILLAGLFQFIWENLNFDENWSPGLWLKIGIPLAVAILVGLGVYWIVGVYRRSCDFMIYTDGEMKKVNWTTRRELVAATKVVILVTILTAFILFMVDWMFISIFRWIGVLRGG